jgi:hypothetical protein
MLQFHPLTTTGIGPMAILIVLNVRICRGIREAKFAVGQSVNLDCKCICIRHKHYTVPCFTEQWRTPNYEGVGGGIRQHLWLIMKLHASALVNQQLRPFAKDK